MLSYRLLSQCYGGANTHPCGAKSHPCGAKTYLVEANAYLYFFSLREPLPLLNSYDKKISKKSPNLKILYKIVIYLCSPLFLTVMVLVSHICYFLVSRQFVIFMVFFFWGVGGDGSNPPTHLYPTHRYF